MTGPVRALFVTGDDSAGRRLESRFEGDESVIVLSFVTSVEEALLALDAVRVDHVVVDSTVGNSVGGADDRLDGVETLVERLEAEVPTDVPIDVLPSDAPVDAPSLDAPVDAAPDGGAATGIFPDGGLEADYFHVLAETLSDAILVIDADSTVQYANPAVEDVFGYRPEELVGESLTELMYPDDAEGHREGVERYLREGERHVDWNHVEFVGRHREGHEVPLEVSYSEFVADGEIRFTGVLRDVSERKRREEKLASLTELLGSMPDAETATDICDLGVEAAVETLGFPNAAIALYDDESNELVSTVQRWAGGEVDDALLSDPETDVAWEIFVAGESRVYADLHAELDDGTEMVSAIAVPLGKYGVFLAGAPDPDAFDSTDQSLAEVMCSTVRSALERAERETALRTQRNELEEKNSELERVNRLNRVMREITGALTRSTSREDLMQAICDRLADSGPYRFAWFGEQDVSTDGIRPRAWAGVEDGYLDEVVVTADEAESLGNGPSGRAVRTKDVQVQNDLLGDPPFAPWREQALKRGYRSSASVPVTYEGTIRGVLNLYADEPGVFGGTEQEVLSELGEFIGYALNALEQRRALVSERSIELDFRVRGDEYPILAFVTETDAEFEFVTTVQRGDDLHFFFNIRGADPEETLAFAETLPGISETRLVVERGDIALYQGVLEESSFLASLVNQGVIPRTITATDGEGRFVVRIRQNSDVRSVVERFEETFDDVELVARREVDEPVMTRQEFEAELAERLTERQEEVARMAYFSGFFEWPRESTAEEIADVLDVSQPTVSRHVRGAERALFGLFFEDG